MPGIKRGLEGGYVSVVTLSPLSGEFLLKVGDKLGVPVMVILLVYMGLLPKIDEGIAIAQEVRALMLVEQSSGVVCRAYAPLPTVR